MADILKFSGDTIIPDTADSFLEKAKAWNMERCVAIGWKADGKFVFGGTHSEIAEALLLVEIARNKLIEAASA